MFGECHAHMIMDGVCFREAAAKHRNGPDEALIRQVLSAYQKPVSYTHLDVSKRQDHRLG